MAASAARSWLAECKDSQQVADGIQHYAPLLRVQGWTLLIADCGKRGEYQKAQAVFDAVPYKNVWHYSAIIGALGACGKWQAAVAQLQHLKLLASSQRSLRPNQVTYSAAITACARGHMLDVALELFAEMQATGLVPDEVTYSIVLSTASRAGDWDTVQQLLEVMHSQGMPARTPVYAAYLRQLCKHEEWNRALSLFLVMQELGVPVTAVMVLDMARTLQQCGRPRMAAHLMKEAEAAGLSDRLQEIEEQGTWTPHYVHGAHAANRDYEFAQRAHMQQLMRDNCWRLPHHGQQSSAPASAAATAGAAGASADACGSSGGGGGGSSISSSISSSRQGSLLLHLEEARFDRFDHGLLFDHDDDGSFVHSEAETEEYAGSFASSSELCSSVATGTLGVSVHGLSLREGACSSALPSPQLLSMMAKPFVTAAAAAGKVACSFVGEQVVSGTAAATVSADGCCHRLSTGDGEQQQ
ncbi:hypothetical protein OEZ86_005639 [Tetradesmus obliquus]|nr:hypothetical protein OEZ86_005639 [Tetradesmus obliquus]